MDHGWEIDLRKSGFAENHLIFRSDVYQPIVEKEKWKDVHSSISLTKAASRCY